MSPEMITIIKDTVLQIVIVWINLYCILFSLSYFQGGFIEAWKNTMLAAKVAFGWTILLILQLTVTNAIWPKPPCP